VTSNTSRWAAEHSRNQSRSTGAQQTSTRSHETVPSHGSDWVAQARCKGQPTDIFFAADNERGRKLRRNERRAKQICRSCAVLEACRNYALNANEPYGIWGALTPSERRHAQTSNSMRLGRLGS
jgi:WhiB family transcriptional regulator, redox-sensing transcriptional regulator